MEHAASGQIHSLSLQGVGGGLGGGGGGSLPILAFSRHQDSDTLTGNHLFSNCTDRCNITPDMRAAQQIRGTEGHLLTVIKQINQESGAARGICSQ